ncbi:reverse transcriptase domain-containing protein [Tanacetum coccineum]
MFAATTPENTLLAYRASTSTNPNPMISPAFVEANYEILKSLLRERRRQIRNEDLRTELGYFSEEYDEEREMEPRPEQNRETTPPLRMRSPRVCRQRERVVGFEEAPIREGGRIERNVKGGGPSELGVRGNGSRGMNLPPLLAAHLGRNENGQLLQSSLTSVYGGHQPSTNTGGNLPHNGTYLSHHAQPFIPSSLHPSNGFIPAHVNSYSQPFTGIVNGQAPSYPPQAHNGNPSFGGTSTHHPQGGYVPQTFTNSNMPPNNGFVYSTTTPSNSYPFYAQPMYAQPNVPTYPNPNLAGLFTDPMGSVTPFVIPVACHMFTYTLKDSARIWWNSQKAGSILNYEDLKAKFRLHFSQQKKFTKMHLAVHNIKQREDDSTRAFATRYTNDTLQILGLHKDQRIYGFVHGLRTRKLVEFLSTYLPSTYKGLMEKTYTWIEAKEVATNGTPNDRRESFKRSKKTPWDNNRGQRSRDRFSPYRGPNHELLSNLSKSPKEILATEKVAKTFEQPPRMFGNRRSRDMTKYCHFHEDHRHDTNDCRQLRN